MMHRCTIHHQNHTKKFAHEVEQLNIMHNFNKVISRTSAWRHEDQIGLLVSCKSSPDHVRSSSILECWRKTFRMIRLKFGSPNIYMTNFFPNLKCGLICSYNSFSLFNIPMLVCFGKVKPLLLMLFTQEWFFENHMNNYALVVKRALHCSFKKLCLPKVC